MERKIKTSVMGFAAQDGAGVNLVRVLGHSTTRDFDPILMLDSFDSINPDDYTTGFPMHLPEVLKQSAMYTRERCSTKTV